MDGANRLKSLAPTSTNFIQIRRALMKPLNFPTEIYFEEEAYNDLSTYSNERILIITSKHGVVSNAAKKLKETAEKENKLEVFNGVLPDPPLSVIAEGTELIKSYNPTVIIGLGGGSALDAAKAMKVDAGFKGIFIAVPTTSGTGSEINDLAVVTDDATNLKLPKLAEGYQPEKAYLIAELTVSMPEKTTIDTGMDVLTHALEAYVARPLSPAFRGHNNFTDPLAEKAVTLVFNNLPKVVKNPEDLEARRMMLQASAIASLAFIKAGLGGVHGISHSTGARLQLAHGRVNSLLLGDLVQYNAGIGRYEAKGHTEIAERYAYLASLVDKKEHTGEQGALRMVELIQELKNELGIENQFSELGVQNEVYDQIIDTIVTTAIEDPTTKTNPRTLKAENIREILVNLR